MSDIPPTKASLDLHIQTPPQPPEGQSLQPEYEERFDEARVTFEKTIKGHYRHGKTEYTRVGALFLTWKDDDMQCKKTEVDAFNRLLRDGFRFETDYFEIPSEKFETGLHKKLSDFYHEYNSPDCLTILYYGGHGYEGKDTKHFKLAAKYRADAKGDPSVFWNDIQTCLRLPECDQLVILDSCYSGKAFTRNEIGKHKFELLASCAYDAKSDAPNRDGSFTKTLNEVLPNLLESNPHGFCTSQLYREVYHSVRKTKPLHFDQSRHSFGKIWLRPQLPVTKPNPETEGIYLDLTLQLSEQPEPAITNELALNLSFLPYVDNIRVENLYASRQQMENFVAFGNKAQKIRPFVRRLHARRQIRRVVDMIRGENGSKVEPALARLLLGQKFNSICDWDSAELSPITRQKSGTWPPTQSRKYSQIKSLSNPLFSLEYKADIPSGRALLNSVFHGVSKVHHPPRQEASATDLNDTLYVVQSGKAKGQNRDGETSAKDQKKSLPMVNNGKRRDQTLDRENFGTYRDALSVAQNGHSFDHNRYMEDDAPASDHSWKERFHRLGPDETWNLMLCCSGLFVLMVMVLNLKEC